jgi:D-glycero-alpha-D-manno-heptose-7-phosphate kinase
VGIEGDIEINCMSDLPARTGLGSSSSFTVALLHALYAFKHVYVEPERLALEAIHIERDLLKERVGCQDQYWAAVGGLRYVEFESLSSIRSRILPIAPARIRQLESSLIMVFTGMTRHANEVLREQVDRTRQNTSLLAELRDLARRGLTVLSGDGPISELGRLLHEGWLLKRQLSSQVTNSSIDGLYQVARDAGALGGKLLGAGAGGFLLLQVDPDARARVRSALAEAPVVPFRFEPAGSRIVFLQENMTPETAS